MVSFAHTRLLASHLDKTPLFDQHVRADSEHFYLVSPQGSPGQHTVRAGNPNNQHALKRSG